MHAATTAPGRRRWEWCSALATVPRPILWLFGLELAIAALHVISSELPRWASQVGDRHALWHLDRERNIPTWFSSLQLASIGLLMVGAAALWQGRRRTPAVLLAAGLLFLSCRSTSSPGCTSDSAGS